MLGEREDVVLVEDAHADRAGLGFEVGAQLGREQHDGQAGASARIWRATSRPSTPGIR